MHVGFAGSEQHFVLGTLALMKRLRLDRRSLRDIYLIVSCPLFKRALGKTGQQPYKKILCGVDPRRRSGNPPSWPGENPDFPTPRKGTGNFETKSTQLAEGIIPRCIPFHFRGIQGGIGRSNEVEIPASWWGNPRLRSGKSPTLLGKSPQNEGGNTHLNKDNTRKEKGETPFNWRGFQQL